MTEPATLTEADVEAKLAAQRDSFMGELAEEKQARLKLEGKIEQQAAAPAERVFTRTEVNAEVEAGRLTQSEADGYIARVESEALRRDIRKDVAADQAERERQTSISSDMDAYERRIPDLREKGSDSRQRVAKEFEYLVKTLGHQADDPATELLAVRAAFGPAEQIRETTRDGIETHQSLSGSSNESGGRQPTGAGPLAGLDERARFHFEGMIQRNAYRGLDDENLKKDVALWKEKHGSRRR